MTRRPGDGFSFPASTLEFARSFTEENQNIGFVLLTRK
jgi:hypothetical protein